MSEALLRCVAAYCWGGLDLDSDSDWLRHLRLRYVDSDY
jgi:hypothetical protein